jgi:hypothetical protein
VSARGMILTMLVGLPHQTFCKRLLKALSAMEYYRLRWMECRSLVRVLRGRKCTTYRVASAATQLSGLRSPAETEP